VIGRKAAQERFSEESFRPLNAFTLLLHRKRISQKLYHKLPTQLCGTHGTHQAWIDSRNLTTITTEWKHRQPIFLHPTVETGAIRQADLSQGPTGLAGQLAESVSSLYTNSFPFH